MQNVKYIHTIQDNADRITESTNSGITVFVSVARLPQSCWNELYQKLWMWGLLHFYCIRNKYL